MDINDKITLLGLKSVALGKAQQELENELAGLREARLAPPIRQDLKAKRLQEIENFYTRRKIK